MIFSGFNYPILLLILLNFIKSTDQDPNGYAFSQEQCQIVYTTVTPPALSTFTYTTTEVVPGGSAGVVTKKVNKPQTVEIETDVVAGSTRTVSFYSVKTKYVSATTTKYSTTTFTTFPNAITTIKSTETVHLFVKGTLTVTYPPVIDIGSTNRYTGAPTSLWLSVI